MPSLSDKSTSPAPAPDTMNLPAKMPRIPDAVIERFPEMEDYQSELDKWWGIVVGTVADTNEDSATVINQNNTGLLNLVVTVDGVTASITELAEIVADGFGNLSGKYTLTVTAGDVVTGMNITSSTGPGVNISEVAFQADKFQIYSGTTKKVMFVADAINDVVRLADTLIVDAANAKVYIGAGNYGNADTAWYVDAAGQMSLKDRLTWDGSTLTIVGDINATTGAIGGFTIGSDYIRDVANSFGLASTVTGGDDVRFWAGETFANRATAPFRLTESGALTAGDAELTGTLTASLIATDSSFFNTGSSANTFPAGGWQLGIDGSGWVGVGPTEIWLVIYYGWSHGTGAFDTRFGKSVMNFTCIENGGCTPFGGGGSFVDLDIIYRVNGGATQMVTVNAVRVTSASGSGSINISGAVQVAGLGGGDTVEFGVKFSGGVAADALNLTALTVLAGNI